MLVFPMESPTGPLQRIARLEEEANQLDDLPSLPSLSGIDFTVEDSPPPRSLSRQQTPSSSKKYSQTTDILPFTSTPAPAAAILRSQSTIFRADNRPSSDGSTRTIKTAVTQQSYPRSSTFSSLPQELSADQISIEKVDYGSGSGTDSAGSAKRAKRSPRIISPRNPVQETLPQPEQDEHDVTSSSADSYFNPAREIDVLDDLASTSFHQALPSPPVAVNDHDYSIPLTGDSPAVTGSARVERMAANVSTRRKLTARRMSTSDVLPPRLAVSSSSSTPSLPSPPSLPSAPQSHFVETKFNKNATLGENASGLPSAFSPLRERNGDSMLSVEIGRHASPRSNNSHSDVMQIQPNEQDHLPATPSVDGSYSKVFVDSFATPREQRSSGEKRKENVLAALRSNTKPRLAKGTPHPKNVSMRSQVPGSAEVFFTATTSDSAIRRPVDSTPKVNQYLSSLNGLLSRQNQSLIKTVSHNHEEMKRLKKDSKKLRMMSLGGSGEDESKSAAEEEGEATRSEELDQQIGGLIKGNSDINLVHQQISEELGLDVDANSSIAHSTVADDQVVELERKVSKLDSVVAGKDQEIVALRQQILEFQGVSVSEEGRSAYVQELQREIFVLKDQVFDALDKVEAKEDENEQIRGEFYISAQKDTAVVAQFSARNEELLAELEVRDRQVAELNALTTDQVREFQETMDALEQELCAGLEEREAGLKTAKEEMERKRQELEEKIATSETIDELNQIVDEFEGEVKQAQVEIAAITLERDDLVKRLELDGSEKLQEANAKIVQLESIIDGKDQEIVEAFAERERLGFELEDAIAKINELESEHSGIYTEFKEKSNTLRQAEEALEESERQILRHEEEMDALRSTLATERMTGAALSTQLAQFRTHATKAKSPLANELFSTSTRDSTVVALEDELEEAQKEIGELKARLVEMEPSEVKDLRIRTLEETKVELETRVQSLKQQVSLVASPNKTLADDSLFFQSVRGLATPRTPGQFMKNVRPCSLSRAQILTVRYVDGLVADERFRQLVADESSRGDREIGRAGPTTPSPALDRQQRDRQQTRSTRDRWLWYDYPRSTTRHRSRKNLAARSGVGGRAGIVRASSDEIGDGFVYRLWREVRRERGCGIEAQFETHRVSSRLLLLCAFANTL